MCVRTIIDANLFGELSSDSVRTLRRWVERKDGVLVYSDGGQYGAELKKSRKTLALFRAYRQRGSALLVPDSRVAEENSRIAALDLQSDDPHLVALARASRTLVLCTSDTRLMRDFLDRDALEDVGRNTRAVYPLRAGTAVQRRFVGARRCRSGQGN